MFFNAVSIAKKKIEEFEGKNLSHLPICVAKTQYSFTDNSKIVSAMYINGDVYFSEHIACGTNETATTNATFGYYAEDKKLYYFEAANVLAQDKKSIEIETNDKIISMAISKDSILLGTDESGIKRAILTDGVPAKRVQKHTLSIDIILSIMEANVNRYFHHISTKFLYPHRGDFVGFMP